MRNLLLLSLLYAGLGAELASATTFNVTKTADEYSACTAANCSLRSAVAAANADLSATAADPHIINVPAGTYVLTLIGGCYLGGGVPYGSLSIVNHVTMRGAGAATTIIDGGHTATVSGTCVPLVAVPGNGAGDGLGLTVRLEGLTLQNAYSTLQTGSTPQPALLNTGGSMTLFQCVVRSNSSAADGIVVGVSTTSFPSDLTLDQTTIDSNQAPGNTSGGSAVVNDGALTVTRSTISNTTPVSLLPQYATFGIQFTGTANVINSTIGANGGGIAGSGVARISHSTFARNSYTDLNPGQAKYILKNSILASADPCGAYYPVQPPTPQYITSMGNNLLVPTSINGVCANWLKTDRIAVVPSTLHMTGLSDNSGPTMTYRLQYGSTAIDTGTCTDTQGNVVATDQRGISRPQDGNGNGTAICDVGAYEARTPETTVDAIAAFNNGVKHGTLVGVGTGSQITTNQATFLSYLTTADTNVHANNYSSACAVLKTAVQASDGKTAQPDLITGSGLATFNALLIAVRTGLGC